MKTFLPVLFLVLSLQPSSAQPSSTDSVLLRKARNHPMQYYVSLPGKWTKTKKWPVVIVIEAAEKQYRTNLMRFVNVRSNLPFILVAPINVNNSRYGRRDPSIFPYSASTWDYIENVGDCKFNADGIMQIISDVEHDFNSESKVFITGFEAGAHTVWQFVFQHPEMLVAAAPVAGKYNQNSCMTSELFSNHPSRMQLPVRSFVGSADPAFGPGGQIYYQWQAALKDARNHSYNNIDEKVIAGKDHIPLPQEVTSWFYEILDH